MEITDYKALYEQEKSAREKAEARALVAEGKLLLTSEANARLMFLFEQGLLAAQNTMERVK